MFRMSTNIYSLIEHLLTFLLVLVFDFNLTTLCFCLLSGKRKHRARHSWSICTWRWGTSFTIATSCKPATDYQELTSPWWLTVWFYTTPLCCPSWMAKHMPCIGGAVPMHTWWDQWLWRQCATHSVYVWWSGSSEVSTDIEISISHYHRQGPVWSDFLGVCHQKHLRNLLSVCFHCWLKDGASCWCLFQHIYVR